ncbi:Xaa-Pro dipeptidyl-peptidase [Goodfellowiella coeruleoviolacea]|nr:Xaa-Pro dipeptidyl-peptidase [Goodfellowiella coeruleoviolacea]
MLLSAVVAGPLAVPSPALAALAAPTSGPVFADGEAQPVFDPTDVVRESLFVTAPVDSDADGRSDQVHVEVVRPAATRHGLRVPVVYQVSPYYAGGNEVANHDVDVELHVPGQRGPGRPAGRPAGAVLDPAGDERVSAALGYPDRVGPQAGPDAAPITSRYDQYLLSRGYALVFAESLGSGQSTGCPTSGGRNETLGARSVVDWLNGRAVAHDAQGGVVSASWATGRVGMIGVSYNGTLPNAVAATGVPGLEAIVPIAAISSWYDYYRAGGAVVAPGGYQGEDTDVLAEYVYTRADRQVCRPVIDRISREQDRLTGDYSAFWAERDYLRDVDRVRAAVLAVHGLNDWNVKTGQVAQWYAALRQHGVPHKLWLHQYGHTDPISLRRDEWLRTLNRWFTRYLYQVANGVEAEPRATLQREDLSWVDEPEWPAPGTQDVRLFPWPGGTGRGALTAGAAVPGAPTVERLADDATQTVEQLLDAASSGNRLRYATGPASTPLRLSGTARAELRVAFDRPAANMTALLVDRAPDGTSAIISRGWADPQNRRDLDRTDPVQPGQPYRLDVTLQPKDYVLAVGHRLEFVLASSDHDYTLRPRPGTGLAVDLTDTSLVFPAVGGSRAVHAAFG